MNIATKKRYKLIDSVLIPLKIAPLHTSLLILYNLVGALVPMVNVWVTANFINIAIKVVSEKLPSSLIALPLTYVVLVIAWNILSGGLIHFVRIRLSNKLRQKLRIAFLEKRANLDYQYIENQDIWDLVKRVCTTPEEKFSNMLNETIGFVMMIITTVSILSILIVQVWWIGVVSIILAIPLFYISALGGRKAYENDKEITKIQRTYGYLAQILSDRETVLERTLFRFTKKLDKTFNDEFEIARIKDYKMRRKWFIRMKAGGVATAMLSIFVMLMLINPVLTGAITVGLFISLVNATFNLVQSMSWQLSHYVDSLSRNKEFFKELTTFAKLDEQKDSCELPATDCPIFSSLAFDNVSFKYPKTEEYILKNLSFTIEAGKHYSFVGINGAGKTTITKLITRLFTEYDGTIWLNGKDIKTYSYPQIKAMFCGVFQDFAKYSITVEDNIKIGNVLGATDEQVQNAVTLVSLEETIDNLAQKIHTPLGKIKEDGVDLSGGQWQRLAMARAVVSPAGVKILDEPTAALDPIAESDLYKRFEQISQGATTLFISHRLGSTKLSDIIYVLENGAVVESGSHEELMTLGKTYAQMFDSQRSWYQ